MNNGQQIEIFEQQQTTVLIICSSRSLSTSMMTANLYRGRILEILDTNLFPSNVRYDTVPNRMCVWRRRWAAIRLNFEYRCRGWPLWAIVRRQIRHIFRAHVASFVSDRCQPRATVDTPRMHTKSRYSLRLFRVAKMYEIVDNRICCVIEHQMTSTIRRDRPVSPTFAEHPNCGRAFCEESSTFLQDDR